MDVMKGFYFLAKKMLPLLLSAFMFLSLASCGESWTSYTDTDWGYTVNYPGSWSFNIQQNQPPNPNLRSVLITGEHAQVSIVCRHDKPGNSLTLPNSVNYTIQEGQKNYLTYNVLSLKNLERKDAAEAISVVTLEQYTEASPIMKINRLMMVKNRYYYYRIEIRAEVSEYDSYSPVIDRIINSFVLNSNTIPLEAKDVPARFTGTQYINSEFGFSFQYPTTWVDTNAGLPVNTVKQFGVGSWFFMPKVMVIVVDQTTGATLQDALVAWQTSVSIVPKTFTATDITINGVMCSKADITYASANGDCTGTIIGFIRNGKRVIIEAVALPSIGGDWENRTQKEDIIGSITIQ